jgi:hypothetical protein
MRKLEALESWSLRSGAHFLFFRFALPYIVALKLSPTRYGMQSQALTHFPSENNLLLQGKENFTRACHKIIGEFVAILFWAYAITKIFVFDLDRYLFGRLKKARGQYAQVDFTNYQKTLRRSRGELLNRRANPCNARGQPAARF